MSSKAKQSNQRKDETQKPEDSIKIDLGKLVDSTIAIQLLSNQPTLPAIINFRIGRALREINKEFEVFDKARKQLCEKYGKLSDDGSRYDIDPDKQSDFELELKELRNSEITLNVSTIKVEHLEKAAGLTASMLMSLDYLIVE